MTSRHKPSKTEDVHAALTWADRGLSVPFTSPHLADARVRKDGNRIEVIIPNPSGGRGNFVMNWGAVEETMVPTLFDRVLYKKIVDAACNNPLEVMKATRSVSAMGLAGPRAQKYAIAEQEDDQTLASLITLEMMLIMTGARDLKIAVIQGNSEARATLREIIRGIAKKHDRTVEGFNSAVDAMSAVIVPIGMKTSTALAGRLRMLATNLPDFCATIDGWAEGQHEDMVSMAGVIINHANDAASAADNKIAAVDAVVAKINPNNLFHQSWGGTLDQIAQIVSEVSWILNGWDAIMPLVLGQKPATVAAKGDFITGVFGRLPIMPISADPNAAHKVEKHGALRGAHRRFVRVGVDWRSAPANLLGQRVVDKREKIRAMLRSAASQSASRENEGLSSGAEVHKKG